MAENKKSFVAYADWIESFEMLDNEEAGKLIKHLLAYVNDLNPELEDRLLKIAFQPIKTQLKRDLNKYEEVRKKRSEAGKKGGEKTQKQAKQANASFAKQKQSNQAVNVNVNDTVNVNGNEKKEREENSRAIPFLKENYPSRWETDFLMKHSKKIKDKNKFVEDFNDTVDQENLEFSDRILFARLGKYARNWIQNQDKFSKPKADHETKYESGKLERF